ncbi:MAG TPA: 5-oxoprolinase subunit PxpB [Thiobacillus sp.]
MAKSETGQYVRHPAGCWVGERGLCVATGELTLACHARLISQNLSEVEDVIPADGSLLVFLRRGMAPSPALWGILAGDDVELSPAAGRLHTVHVEYGGAAGPDLAALATRAGMDASDYIACHAAAEYTVAFLGFQPGFPYLKGLPDVLQAPRKATPRTHVAAGSVALGGAYSGIYPAAGPGGWQIIGRAQVCLFDPQRNPPNLLLPGDRLRFVPK